MRSLTTEEKDIFDALGNDQKELARLISAQYHSNEWSEFRRALSLRLEDLSGLKTQSKLLSEAIATQRSKRNDFATDSLQKEYFDNEAKIKSKYLEFALQRRQFVQSIAKIDGEKRPEKFWDEALKVMMSR